MRRNIRSLEHLAAVDQLGVQRHAGRGLLDLGVQEAEDQGLVEDHICLLGEQADPGLDVFVVGEVDLLRDVEALLHGDGEIGDALDLLARPLGHCELRHPHAVDEPLCVFDDVVEDEVEEDEELHPHQLEVLGRHQEEPDLGDVRVQDVDQGLGVDGGAEGEQLLLDVQPQELAVVQQAGLHAELYLGL